MVYPLDDCVNLFRAEEFFLEGYAEQNVAPSLVVGAVKEVVLQHFLEVLAGGKQFDGRFEGARNPCGQVRGGHIGSEEVEEKVVHLVVLGHSEDVDDRGTVLEGSSIEIGGEEHGYLIPLQVFLVAIELLEVLKEVDIEFKTALGVVLVEDGEYFLEDIRVGYFDGKEEEYFDLGEDVGQKLVFGHVDDEVAEEVEVYFGCYLLVYPLVNVVVLVRGLALPLLEVLVELAAIFEEEMEDLLDGVVDGPDLPVPFQDHSSFEGAGPYKHALEDVYHLYFKFRVGDLLVYGQEDVQDVCLVLGMGKAVEFRRKDPQQDHKERPASAIALDVVLFVVLFSSRKRFRFN